MSAFADGSMNSQAAGIGALFIGGAALVFAAGLGWVRYRLWSRGRRVTGTVTAIEEKRGGKSNQIYYYPVVAFRTEEGADQVWKRSMGENSPGYVVGAAVPMIYDPADPRVASIGTFAEVFGIAIMIGTLGLFFAGIGAAIGPRDAAGLRAVLDYYVWGNLEALGLGKWLPRR